VDDDDRFAWRDLAPGDYGVMQSQYAQRPCDETERETPCGFERAWLPRCPKPQPCPEHAEAKCWCGARAVRECPYAMGLICGAPLCSEHRGCEGHS
jgi:hypothetical protein